MSGDPTDENGSFDGSSQEPLSVERQWAQKLDTEILSGDLKEVQEIINQGRLLGIDLSRPIDDTQQTALHIASCSGHLHMVDFFLSMPDPKPDVNSTDKYGWSPLLCAASRGYLEICASLLKAGADPKLENNQKTTTLHYLSRKNWGAGRKPGKGIGYLDLLQLIVDKGVDINSQNYMGETALMQAAAKGNDAAVKFLLDHKASWKLTNNKGDTAATYAANGEFKAITKMLNEAMDKHKIKVLNKHIKLDSLGEVVALMKHPEQGITLKEKKNFFITHRNCFEASELVDWMIRNLPIHTREDAVAYGNQLLKAQWIQGVSNRNSFKDNNKVFVFSNDVGIQPNTEKDDEKVTLASFERIRVLGKGAFGKVILVRKIDTNKEYAMKVMSKQLIINKPRDFKNLMTEKKILQNDCPFLVHLHWAIQTEAHFHLIMDFMGGGDLYTHLKRNKKLSEKVVQFVAAELVLALSYLHSRGIIYRDLKPHNVLVDIDGHICLADFGLSKEVNELSGVGVHTACGTPSYSAPEVLQGMPYGKSIDWWSLGILMYQFLVGHVPFDFNGDFRGLIRKVLGGVADWEDVSPAAREIISAFLEKDPAKRLDDVDIMKTAPFFKDIDWTRLEVKNFPSPIKISSRREDILKNFEKYEKMPLDDPVDAVNGNAVPHVSDWDVDTR